MIDQPGARSVTPVVHITDGVDSRVIQKCAAVNDLPGEIDAHGARQERGLEGRSHPDECGRGCVWPPTECQAGTESVSPPASGCSLASTSVFAFRRESANCTAANAIDA
jgi:hypothetical protein